MITSTPTNVKVLYSLKEVLAEENVSISEQEALKILESNNIDIYQIYGYSPCYYVQANESKKLVQYIHKRSKA